MRSIYIDLLVIINLYITFFLLKGTAAFLHRRITNRRILVGSFAGGLSSLIILLPALPFLLNIGMKAATGMLIVLLAFGYNGGYVYFKNALIFIIINVVFAGLTMLLWFFAAPLGMEYNNGFAYFDISFIALVLSTAAAYGLIRILRYILDVKQVGDKQYKITISAGGKSVTLDALADSGNLLFDYFSGLPVVICPETAIKTIPQKSPRLLPYNTIDSYGLISVFRADEVVIKTDDKPDKSVAALIGVSEAEDVPAAGGVRADALRVAIFNPKLLI